MKRKIISTFLTAIISCTTLANQDPLGAIINEIARVMVRGVSPEDLGYAPIDNPVGEYYMKNRFNEPVKKLDRVFRRRFLFESTTIGIIADNFVYIENIEDAGTIRSFKIKGSKHSYQLSPYYVYRSTNNRNCDSRYIVKLHKDDMEILNNSKVIPLMLDMRGGGRAYTITYKLKLVGGN